MIIIGTIGQSTWIQQLIASGKIDRKELEGKREKYLIQTIEQPFQGVDEAVVIAGSDKRGAIYGIYLLLIKKQSKKSYMPFAPCIFLATTIVILTQQNITNII